MRRCDVALAAMPTQFVVSRMEQTRVFGRVIRDPAPNCVSKKEVGRNRFRYRLPLSVPRFFLVLLGITAPLRLRPETATFMSNTQDIYFALRY